MRVFHQQIFAKTFLGGCFPKLDTAPPATPETRSAKHSTPLSRLVIVTISAQTTMVSFGGLTESFLSS